MARARTTTRTAPAADAPAPQRLDLPDHATPKPTTQPRPTLYDQAMVDAILDDIASGMSLRRACLPADRPDERTFRRWVLNDHHGIAPHYARARECQAHALVDAVIDVVTDAGPNDDPQLLRVKSDNAKWAAARILPKQYGDRIDVNSTNTSVNVSVGYVVRRFDENPLLTVDGTALLDGTAVRVDSGTDSPSDPQHVV